MKEVFSASYKIAKKGKKKYKVNPWAVCTKSVGREDADKYERCVMDVKKQQKKSNSSIRTAQMNPTFNIVTRLKEIANEINGQAQNKEYDNTNNFLSDLNVELKKSGLKAERFSPQAGDRSQVLEVHRLDPQNSYTMENFDMNVDENEETGKYKINISLSA